VEEKLNLILNKIETMDKKIDSIDSRPGSVETDVKGLNAGQKEIKVDIQKVKEKIDQNHMESIDESAEYMETFLNRLIVFLFV